MRDVPVRLRWSRWRPSPGLPILVVWTLLTASPFVWMVLTALKPNIKIFNDPWGFPSPPQFQNFERAWSTGIGSFVVNSVTVVSASLLLTMTVATLAAYVFGRYTFPGRRFLFYFFMLGMMFPIFLAIVPLFFLLRDIGLLGTHAGLVLVYGSYWLPFNVFFLTSFFRTLPSELAEAAVIDGASHFQIFRYVMLPLALPGIITMAIFTFIGQWNEYLLPLILIPDKKDFLISQGLAALSTQMGQYLDWSALFAGLVLATLPTLVIYLIFSRRIQRGLTAGSVKG